MREENKKIRVMQITHDLKIGGLQRVVLDLCKNIDKKKFIINVCCLRSGGELKDEVEKAGVEVEIIPRKKKGTDYFSFLKLYRILRKKNPIFYTYTIPSR